MQKIAIGCRLAVPGREPSKCRRAKTLHQMLLVMKLTMLLLTVALLNVHASGIAQTVTISGKDISLKEVFKTIKQQTGYVVFANKSDAMEKSGITLDVVNMPLRDLLDLVLKGRPYEYDIRDKTIVLSAKVKPVWQQEPPVSGIIRNMDGKQLAGATIRVKGKNISTTSNEQGKFELKAESGDVLLITYVGYKSREITVSSVDLGTIVLEASEDLLKEVIVNKGYYATTSRLNTGSVGRVVAKEIEKSPVSNPLAALQGRVPGLEITQQTGIPGGNFKVRIRGTNSISNGNDPLYIIDGVPYFSTSMAFSETSGSILPNGGNSPFNSINPLDIESIEVLKDADATAIYGSRGANGVILITTKRGKSGKTKVDLNYYAGAGKVTRRVSMLNLRQYLDMRYEAFRNDGVDFRDPAVMAEDLKVLDTTRFTDWQKELMGGTARFMDAQLTLSGGDNYTQFSFGGGYRRETTVFPGSNADRRITAQASINNIAASGRLKTHLAVSYSSGFTNLPSRDLTSRALYLVPNGPALYKEDGQLNWDGWGTETHNENPLANLNRPYESVTNNLRANVVSSYAILPDLDIKTNLGYTITTMKAITVVPASSLNPAASRQNISSFSNGSFQNWIVEPQINWHPSVGNGRFDVLAGITMLEQRSEGLSQYATGFSSEALMKNIAAAGEIVNSTDYYNQYRYGAVFGRINYQYNEKYIINITGRRDGSSRFGSNRQFANFGAAGLAWIFSKEQFVQDALHFLSFGKLRASYGATGNDQLGDYVYLDSYTSSGIYQGRVGLTPVRLSNPDFAWEINRKFEVAAELGFLRDRVQLTVNYYRNRSSSQLVGFPLSPATGFVNIQGNFPATVQNKGIELEVRTVNIDAGKLHWSTFLNLSVPRNKLVEFPNMDAFPAFVNTYVVGEPLSIRKLYQYNGLNTTTGLWEFEDVDKNGSYDFRDQQTVRFIGQNFYGGLQNTLRYRSFQLDVLFQFIKQTADKALLNLSGAVAAPASTGVLDRWQKPGDNAMYQRLGVTAAVTTPAYLYFYSDQVVGDASYIRFKNLSLSYSVPKAILSRVDARIFIQGQNLLTFTKYEGMDPENLNHTILPPLRVITAGAHLTF